MTVVVGLVDGVYGHQHLGLHIIEAQRQMALGSSGGSGTLNANSVWPMISERKHINKK